MSRWRIATPVARKVLRFEWRSSTNRILPFAGVPEVMFAFGVDAIKLHQRAGSPARRIVDVVGGRVA